MTCFEIAVWIWDRKTKTYSAPIEFGVKASNEDEAFDIACEVLELDPIIDPFTMELDEL